MSNNEDAIDEAGEAEISQQEPEQAKDPMIHPFNQAEPPGDKPDLGFGHDPLRHATVTEHPSSEPEQERFSWGVNKTLVSYIKDSSINQHYMILGDETHMECLVDLLNELSSTQGGITTDVLLQKAIDTLIDIHRRLDCCKEDQIIADVRRNINKAKKYLGQSITQSGITISRSKLINRIEVYLKIREDEIKALQVEPDIAAPLLEIDQELLTEALAELKSALGDSK